MMEAKIRLQRYCIVETFCVFIISFINFINNEPYISDLYSEMTEHIDNFQKKMAGPLFTRTRPESPPKSSWHKMSLSVLC